jgi:hypothetical protein
LDACPVGNEPRLHHMAGHFLPFRVGMESPGGEGGLLV